MSVRPRANPSRRNIQDRWVLARDPLFRLEFGAMWKWMRRQPLSFWLVCLYLFNEYVRPQAIFATVEGLPIPFWTIVLCFLAFLFEGAKVRQWHLGDGLMAAEAVVVIISSITAYDPSYSRAKYSVFFGWLIVYFLITNIVTTRRRFYVFLMLYLAYCTKMTQHGVRNWAAAGFGFIHTGVGCAPGWFQNSGECGAQMAILFPVSLFLILTVGLLWSKWKRWAYVTVLPLGALLTILASSSRGAVIGLAATGVWFVAKSRKRLKVLVGAALVAALSWHFLPMGFKVRFYSMGQDPDSLARLGYWRNGLKIMHDFPVFGLGYYNWLPYYRRFYDPRGLVPHNIFIEAGAQTGYVGLFVFVLCILGTFAINSRTRNVAKRLPGVGVFYRNMAHGLDAALIGFLVTGSFVTILYYPFFWINFAMTVSLNVAAFHDARRGLGSLGRAGLPRRLGPASGSRGSPPHPGRTPAPIAARDHSSARPKELGPPATPQGHA